MIVRAKDIEENNTTACINGKCVIARPINYQCRTFKERLREVWRVFTGKYDPFEWPEGQ